MIVKGGGFEFVLQELNISVQKIWTHCDEKGAESLLLVCGWLYENGTECYEVAWASVVLARIGEFQKLQRGQMFVMVVWDKRASGGAYRTKANEVEFIVIQFFEY
jgi:hypothetical protein